ncbi:HPr family phosphocarrier protein [Halobellus clavatus]|jgi:phosphocarrier protein|uniref:Phosphocarrier protein HPr n=1 Tax=Halobellus clavatus TaxID=660517 RepID=A0A1H3F3H6_9EURY|nr:HPr family phosphocarrier protein [Halobellus clavatus]SDX85430.1 Phosphocarrier protein HPr [Halobellus clavatus]
MPERLVTVVPEDGIHARPASKFVEAANEAAADIRVGRPGEDLVNAASMLSVTGLDVGPGEEVQVVAEGDGAETALDQLERILRTPEDEL